MQKNRIDFEASEWLFQDLETYGSNHPELGFRKEILEGYIQSLKDELDYLKKAKEYEKEAGKSAEDPSNSSFNQDSSTAPTKKELRPTSKPQQPLVQAHRPQVRYMNKEPIDPERVIDLANMTALLKDGTWHLVQKKQDVLALKLEQTRAIMELKKDYERTKTEEIRKREEIRAEARTSTSTLKRPTNPIPADEPILKAPCPLTRNANYCINNLCDRHGQCLREGLINNNRATSEHGAPVADMVV